MEELTYDDIKQGQDAGGGNIEAALEQSVATGVDASKVHGSAALAALAGQVQNEVRGEH